MKYWYFVSFSRQDAEGKTTFGNQEISFGKQIDRIFAIEAIETALRRTAPLTAKFVVLNFIFLREEK